MGFWYFKEVRFGRDPACDLIRDTFNIGANGTFPDDRNPPTKPRKGSDLRNVAGNIALKLRDPEINIVRRHSPKFAARMVMPVTAVDEDDYIPSREGEIGFAGETLLMEAVPKPPTV